jgi:2-desacetyl-2-hydroxyethyl bacteriochlorophyllide A dehydrogenase
METMLAARYLGPNRIEVEEVPIPEIGPGEALVQVEACGFCGSDLNIIAGTHPRARAPLTIGHELSGRIVQLAEPGSGFETGDLVTVFPLIGCGQCYACTHGFAHVCRTLRLYGFDVDGGMAQFLRLPVSTLISLPANMPARIGALIEPLAVAVHGCGRTPLQAVRVAAVLGAGPIGLLTALVLRARGIEHVLISDVIPARLELAAALGLTASPAGDELKHQVMELSHGDGADVVFECAGHPSSAREMTQLARSRGAIVALGVFKKPVEVDLQAVNFKELEIVGSRVYERSDFAEAIRLASGLPLERIITHSFPLDSVRQAFDAFQSASACKVLVLPS